MKNIVIKVLKGTKRPYYLKNKGMTSEGVYLRLGATNKQASRDDNLKMMMEDSGVRFEDNISKEQNLTFNALIKEFKNQNIEFDNTKMKNLGLLTEQDLYTNLAYIVSDQNTFPIKIAIYIELINKYITQPEIAKILNLSENCIYKNLKSLKNKNLISRIGANKNGHWEIRDNVMDNVRDKEINFDEIIKKII